MLFIDTFESKVQNGVFVNCQLFDIVSDYIEWLNFISSMITIL